MIARWMTMWRILTLVALLGLVSGAPAFGGPSAPQAVIAGFAPYILGTATQEVLSADPELARGNYPVWTNNLLTQRYGRPLVAPLRGFNYIATVGVQFWQGRLAVVILKWPATAFDSVSRWRHAAETLHTRIISAYAKEVVKDHTVSSGSVWKMDLADSKGNELSAWSNDRPLEITMVYLWAPYAKALESTPTPESNY
jgi:hypothetical protein